MISYSEALALVLSTSHSLGSESVPLKDATGCFLDENIVADRDFPPFNRVTMDGIAIRFDSFNSGLRHFQICGLARAGNEQVHLSASDGCIEVTTGCILPEGSDTVVPYEHLTAGTNRFTVNTTPVKGQNIHKKGSDTLKNSLLLQAGKRITAKDVAVLASVGKSTVTVKRKPEVTLIATGDELIPIEMKPELHQIRLSNTYMLNSALQEFGIVPKMLHVKDDREALRSVLMKALSESDVLILSGGVSMGKFDYLPQILEDLGINCLFHKVAQKPGKPIWFGTCEDNGCMVFSLPGNPVSTFVNYLLYFKTWLYACWNLPLDYTKVICLNEMVNKSQLVHFLPVTLTMENGLVQAKLVPNNGSGDFLSLVNSDGFIQLNPNSELQKGSFLTFIPSDFLL